MSQSRNFSISPTHGSTRQEKSDYVPIHSPLDLEEDDIFQQQIKRTRRQKRGYIRHAASLLLISILSIVVVLQQVQLRRNGLSIASLISGFTGTTSDSFSYTVDLDLPRNVPRLIHADTKFLDPNNTWDEVDAGHGVVALDTTWAMEQGLPKTMSHPRDQSKSIYTIAAYHSIHCLKFLRQHYLQLAEGAEPHWDLEHDMHCFDGLRQMIMCDANSNLLWSTGRKDVGHGQTIMCRDWDTLRDWATENTACYSDLPYPSKVTRWGRCDGGDDGLPHGSLL